MEQSGDVWLGKKCRNKKFINLWVRLMKSAIWERRNVAKKKKKLCWMFGLCLKENRSLHGKYL